MRIRQSFMFNFGICLCVGGLFTMLASAAFFGCAFGPTGLAMAGIGCVTLMASPSGNETR